MSADLLFADGRRYSREWLEANEEKAQAILRRHKNTYPLCLCRKDGVPMHIRELSLTHKLYLARMPGTGPDHAVDCPSYEPVHGKAEEDALETGAIAPLSDGRILFRLDVGFGIRDNAAHPPVDRAPPAELPQTVRDAQSRLGLFALLQCLWEQAELHHWHPKMQGRRRYKQVHDRLLAAADNIVVKGFPLRHRLFVPKPFQRDRATELSLQRFEELSRLARGANGQRRRFLVLARIRDLKANADAVRLRLAQVGDDLALQMQRSTWERLCKRWQIEEPGESEEGLMIWGLFLIDQFQNHVLISRAAALMQTTEHYIPIFRPPEVALAYGLVESGRRFIKLLVFDGRPSRNGPAFILTDVGQDPVPLYIVEGGLPETSTSGEWYWHVDRQDMWPELPKPRSRTARETIGNNQQCRRELSDGVKNPGL